MAPRSAFVVSWIVFASCSGTPSSDHAAAPPPNAPSARPATDTAVDDTAPKDTAPKDATPEDPAPAAAKPAPAKPAAFAGWNGAPPQWIWSSAAPGAREIVVLERAFDVPRPISRATLRASGDNAVRAYLNGELVGEHAEWSDALVADVGADVRRGENALVLVAKNDGGQAGAWAELVVEDESGKRVRVVTDGSWTASSLGEDASFAQVSPRSYDRSRTGPAHAFGAFGVSPWNTAVAGPRAEAVARVESDSGHALPASAIELPPGFAAELVYEVPRSTQGSWVTMCEDPHGRLYVGDQHGKLYRVTPAAAGADPSTTRVEPVAVDIGSSHGLCWAYDSLYVVVSERDPGRVCGLYRLRDTDGDDQLDASQLLREFAGDGEHGAHAVRLGPDGKLWIMAGNHVDVPDPLEASRVPRTWAEDILLPRIDDPNGHAVGRMAPGGWLARTDEDGKHLELYSAGYRNAYDFAFSPLGEPFTFDSDMEWDVGAPWYRETRIVHCASGTEFGWRGGSGNWCNDYVDTWPSACDLGRTSPTGVEFGTNAKFPEKYRRALYACDWAFGAIYAVHLEPYGATWRGKSELFAHGQPFQSTDALVGKDGSLYVTTGGRNTRSALYRIAWTGALDEKPSAPERSSVVQKRRLELEALHVTAPRTPAQLDAIVRGLASRDRFLSGAARVALELTPAEQWEAVWRVSSSPHVALAALHSGNQDSARVMELLERVFAMDPTDLSRVEMLRLAQVALMRASPPVSLRSMFRHRAETDLAGKDVRAAREAAMLLAYLDAPGIVDTLLARIEASTTQEDAIHDAYCLRVVKSGWTHASRERLLDFFDRKASTFRGGESLVKFVARIRADCVAGFTDEERAGFAARLAPPAPPAKAVAAPATFVRRWTRPELDALLAAPLSNRSFENGRDAYARSTCVACHRIGDAGGATGPDLTSVASRFGIADMLDAIVDPSKTISDQYRDTELRTVEGDLVVGRVESAHGGVLRVRRAPSDELVEIDEADVEMRRPYPLSRMPSGLLDTLDEAGVLDLFAYLRSAGSPDHPVFAPRAPNSAK